MRRRGGFTLVETLVALVMVGVLGTALFRLLVGQQRLYRVQAERVALTEALRETTSILAGELRELSSREGDVIAMGTTSLAFEATEGLYVLCAQPDTGRLDVVVDRSAAFERRAVTAGDSVFLFAENDPGTRFDDGWVSAAVAGVTVGAACPGGRASLGIRLAGVPAARLAGVGTGSPVRVFRPTWLLLYRGGDGAWWLGSRQYQPASAVWSTTQPVAGPLTADGVAFTYADSAGVVTAAATSVATIGIRVVSRSTARISAAGAPAPAYLAQELDVRVALRNNPRF